MHNKAIDMPDILSKKNLAWYIKLPRWLLCTTSSSLSIGPSSFSCIHRQPPNIRWVRVFHIFSTYCYSIFNVQHTNLIVDFGLRCIGVSKICESCIEPQDSKPVKSNQLKINKKIKD